MYNNYHQSQLQRQQMLREQQMREYARQMELHRRSQLPVQPPHHPQHQQFTRIPVNRPPQAPRQSFVPNHNDMGALRQTPRKSVVITHQQPSCDDYIVSSSESDYYTTDSEMMATTDDEESDYYSDATSSVTVGGGTTKKIELDLSDNDGDSESMRVVVKRQDNVGSTTTKKPFKPLDGYKKDGKSRQDIISESREEFLKRFDGWRELHTDDFRYLIPGNKIRYMKHDESAPLGYLYRAGGILIKNKYPDYLVLKPYYNNRSTWCVPLKSKNRYFILNDESKERARKERNEIIKAVENHKAMLIETDEFDRLQRQQEELEREKQKVARLTRYLKQQLLESQRNNST